MKPGSPFQLPSALSQMAEIAARLRSGRPAFFLDYDGTLTPIVARPELAVMSDTMRHAVATLAGLYPVAIVSGRGLADVRQLVGIERLTYAGAHGFEIAGPQGSGINHQVGLEFAPLIERLEQSLHASVGSIPGVLIERKRLSVAVHWRQVDQNHVPYIEQAFARIVADNPQVRQAHGKCVFELQPAIDWHKGRAVQWLIQTLGRTSDAPIKPVYIGDDVTDEDAFGALADDGVGIIVCTIDRPTAATYSLRDIQEVETFLQQLARALALR